MKKRVLSALLITIGTILVGCTQTYGASDIKSYIRNDLGLKKFELSEDTEEYTGEDNYTDIIWHAMDLEHSISFDIIDDYYYEGEACRNQLRNNYLANFASEYEKSLPEDVNLSYSFEDKEDYTVTRLFGTFKNKAELNERMKELDKVYSYYEELGLNSLSISYILTPDSPYINNTSSNLYRGAISGMLEKGNTPDEDMYNNMIMECIDHRLFDNLEGISEEEINAFINSNPEVHHLYQDGVMLDGLIASTYGYGVSFATFYEILKQNSFNPSGNAWAYSFIGTDGNEYEISYEFNDYPYVRQDAEELGYYYLKNGEKMPMKYSFYNHFDLSFIEEITGIKLSEE